VVFNVPDETHITSLDLGLFYVNIDSQSEFDLRTPQYPPTVDFEGQKVFQGEVPVVMKFKLDKSLIPGDYPLKINFGYQLCAETGNRMCFLPQNGDTTLTISIVPANVTPIPSAEKYFANNISDSTLIRSQAETSLEERFATALGEGSVLAFILVFIAGVLTGFTPCVYPVIPLTVGYIGARAQGKKLRGFVLSLFLVLGIATVYSILGIIASATGSFFGAYTQHPAILIFVAVIFAGMGVSMLGAFDIALPASWQTKMQTERKGFLGAYLVGMITGLVAAPCVGPVLVALLAWVAKSGNLLLGFTLLFTYAIGIGVLFIIIGTFVGVLASLPRAGNWMETVKRLFGALLIAGAILIIKPLLPLEWYLLVWGIFLIFVGVIFKAIEPLITETKIFHYISKSIALLILIMGILFFSRGLSYIYKWDEPSKQTAPLTTQNSNIDWIVNDAEIAFSQAKNESKSLVMDFYADWCSACREMEEITWVNSKIIARNKEFVFLKIDLTKPSAEMNAIQRKYNVQGLPTVILFDKDGNEVRRFSGFKDAETTLRVLSFER
jgi:thiol:disulfide interchange protein DsbD